MSGAIPVTPAICLNGVDGDIFTFFTEQALSERKLCRNVKNAANDRVIIRVERQEYGERKKKLELTHGRSKQGESWPTLEDSRSSAVTYCR